MISVALFLVIIGLSSAATAPGNPFVWSDCSTDASSQAIQVVGINASPIPLVYPGPLTLSIHAIVKKPVYPGAVLKVTLMKTVLGIETKVPCVADIGSCIMDLCQLLDPLTTSTDPGIQNLRSQAHNMFTSAGAHVECPVQPQNISITDFKFNVPDLSHSSVLAVVANGDYKVKLLTQNPATGQELGCVTFNAGLRSKQHFGFIFG